MERTSSKEMDQLLGVKFDVLDHGFIAVVDYMGNDELIARAARNSYGKGTKSISDDTNLIRYLLRHKHTTPFEMCEIILQVKVPMDTWRQWIRHRTASINEYSTRYSIAIDEKQKTPEGSWRSQSKDRKQGSGDFLPINIGSDLTTGEIILHKAIMREYEKRLEAGVAREQARKDLPLSNYTLAYWKIDLHNLLHFLSLRMDFHAQYEIRQYANIIGDKIIAKWVPITWKAFNDYNEKRDAIILTKPEIDFMNNLVNYEDLENPDEMEFPENMTKWEIDEFKEKLFILFKNK